MKRVLSPIRHNLRERIEEVGFQFASMDDGRLYWDESVRYEFTLEEIERDLEAPTNELWSMCLEVAAEAATREETMASLGIPPWFMDAVADSWRQNEPTLYGRFDLAYDGDGPAKMLELNADTPTSIFEAAVFQWTWLEDLKALGQLPADTDQFNALHERLVAQWRAIGAERRLHLVCLDNTEDRVTVEYLADCAAQGGLDPHLMLIGDLGVARNRFVDRSGMAVDYLFKLYPWEWLLADPLGRSPSLRTTAIVEPAWKMLLSNKALLVELWRRFPRHPNLLEAHHDSDPAAAVLKARPHASKPVHGREGANVGIVDGSKWQQEIGPYQGARIVQDLGRLFRTSDGHAVVGSWIVGRRASGIGIREDVGRITTNTARFIPHIIIG